MTQTPTRSSPELALERIDLYDLTDLQSIWETETGRILAVNEQAFNRACALTRAEEVERVDLSRLY
jgi:hypothetical protein